MLKVKNIYSKYEKNYIVKNVSFNVKKGGNLCIVGPNGCGKSTLLKSIANLLDYEGTVEFDNQDIKSLSRKELSNKICLMSQITNIYFPYTVYETVSFGRYSHLHGIFSSLSVKDKEIILESLDKVNLLDKKDELITNLSGGQLQRVFLARTFCQDPEIILLDEPTNHLDLKHQIELLDYVSEWTKKNRKIVVAVLHDLNLVNYFSDEVCLLYNGEVVDIGKSKDVFSKENLKNIYDMDVKNFMIKCLEKWK